MRESASERAAGAETDAEFSRLQVLLAELQATCAEIHGAKSAHSLQVRTFYALNELSRLITVVPSAQLKQVQPGIEKCLLELLSIAFAEACLTARLHDRLQACWTLLYTQGDSRNVLQVYERLMAIVSKSAKSKTMAKAKSAAMLCMAALCRAQGRLLLGHLSDSIKLFGKMISSSSEPIIRKAAVFALGETLESCGAGGAHAHIEALRFLKLASIDKSSFVRLIVGSSLVKLSVASNNFTTITLDQCASISRKGFDDPVFSVQLAFAQSFGVLIAQSALQNDALEEDQPGASTSPPAQSAGQNPDAEDAAKRGAVSGLTGLSNLSTSLTRKRTVMKAYTTRAALDMFVQEIGRAGSRKMKIVLAFAMATFAQTLLEEDRTEVRAKRMMEGIVAAAMAVAQLKVNLRPRAGKSGSGPATMGFNFSQPKPATSSAFDYADDPNWLHRSLGCYLLREVLEGALSQRLSMELAGMLVKMCIDTAGNSNLAPALARRASSSSSVGLSKKKKKRRKRKGLCWERSSDELIVALRQLARLITASADASLVLEEDLIELLPTLLEHPKRRVRLQAASTLYASATHLPDLAPRLLLPMLQNLGTLHAEVAVAEATDSKSSSPSADDSGNTMLTMEGYINGISALIYASSVRDGCASIGEHTIVAVLGYAKALVARQHDGAVKDHASARCVSGGWALIGALVTQGPRWTLFHLDQLMRAWDVSFSSFSARRGQTAGSLTTLACVTSAAVALVTFARCNEEIISAMPRVAQALLAFLRRLVAIGQHQKPSGSTERSLCVRLQCCAVELAECLPGDVLFVDGRLVSGLLRITQKFLCGKSSTTLLSEGGVLSESEEVLNGTYPCNTTAVQDQAMDDGADPLGSQVWRFGIDHQPTPAFSALMNAVPLSSAEVLAFSASAMVWRTQVPPPPLIAAGRIPARGVDASVRFFAQAFTRLDAARQDEQLTRFVQELQDTEGAQKTVLARNILAALHEMLARDDLRLDASWADKARGILFAACASPQAIIRRASAVALGRLARLDASMAGEILGLVAGNLKDSASMYTRAGSLYALTFLTESSPVPMNVVYTACKQTAEPGKSWALHAWSRLLDASTTDAAKYAKPTLALINAHLLADEDKDKAQRQIPSSHTSAIPLVALMRMINSLIANLGPEADTRRFADVWRALILVPWEPLQCECIRFVSQLAYINAEAFLLSNRRTIRHFLLRHLLPSPRLPWPSLSRQTLALTALLRVAERDTEVAHNPSTLALCFAAFEAYTRRLLPSIGRPTWPQELREAQRMQQTIRSTMVHLLQMAPSQPDEALLLCLRIANGRVAKHVKLVEREKEDADVDVDADEELFRAEAKEELALPEALREVSWQTRLLALELLCSLDAARLQRELDGVVRSACQLAAMSIAHAPIYAMQRKALELLQRVLDTFAEELKDYEVQLNASIRACFAVGACAHVQQLGCALTVRMITSGLTESTRRFLRLLLPPEDDEDMDMDMDVMLDEDEPFESDASKARIAVARLEALAKLFSVAFVKPEAMTKRTQKEMIEQMETRLDGLVTDWTAAVRDYLLMTAFPDLLVMHPMAAFEALFTIPEVQDAYEQAWQVFHIKNVLLLATTRAQSILYYYSSTRLPISQTLVDLALGERLGAEEAQVSEIVALACCAYLRQGVDKVGSSTSANAATAAGLMSRLVSSSKLTEQIQATCLRTLVEFLAKLSDVRSLRNKVETSTICAILDAVALLLPSSQDKAIQTQTVDLCLALVRQCEPGVGEFEKLGFDDVRGARVGSRKATVKDSAVLCSCLKTLRAYNDGVEQSAYRPVILAYAGMLVILCDDGRVIDASTELLQKTVEREPSLLQRLATALTEWCLKDMNTREELGQKIPGERLKSVLLLSIHAGVVSRATVDLWKRGMRSSQRALNLAGIQALEEVSKEGREDVLGWIGPELIMFLQTDEVLEDADAQEAVATGARLALRLCVMNQGLSKVVISTLAYLATQEVNSTIVPLAKQCILGLAQKRPEQFKATVQEFPAVAQAAMRTALS